MVRTTLDKVVNNVRTLLRVSGMTQTEFARKCGWAPPRVTEFFQGRYAQTFDTLDLFCRVFNDRFGSDMITQEHLTSEHMEIPAEIFSEVA